MTGNLKIDGFDAYEMWGVAITRGSLESLIAYPPLKPVDSNDWQEEDGIEVDLTSPQLDTRKVSIRFAICGMFRDVADFINTLSDATYHTFEVCSIGRTYKLRMTDCPNLTESLHLGFVAVEFADDFPLRDYTYIAPSSTIAPYSDYFIDDLPFTEYGVRVLKGSLSQVKKMPEVKEALMRNLRHLPGVSYDQRAPIKFKAKEVNLYLLFRAATLSELWRNYDALLYDLVRPGLRAMYVSALEKSFPCYYKDAQVTYFAPDGKIWMNVTLKLTFPSGFRIDSGEYLLASENGMLVGVGTDLDGVNMKPEA